MRFFQSCQPALMLVSFTSLLVFIIACGASASEPQNSSAPETVMPTPDLTTLAGRYQAAGQKLHQERLQHNRGVVVRWADGSHWEDGVSHELPKLPLHARQEQRDGLTCIQAETLEAATFPSEMADRSNWHVQPNAAKVVGEWERRHAKALWGSDRKPVIDRLRRDVFTDWCGQMMQPAR